MSIERISEVWPEWQVVEEIGKGSYGTVYKAVRHEMSVTSFSAIKIISIPQNEAEVTSLYSEGMDEAGARTYFQEMTTDFVREIKLMESMKGISNVVSIEDFRVEEKKDAVGWDIFIRMELLTPFNESHERNMTVQDIIKLGVDICSALEVCSKKNIIHRDIKPENIFISDFGDYKIGDFGIAREMEKANRTMSSKGTYNYMAPEVFAGQKYDATVDIYSLGLVLYKLLNNHRMPFLDVNGSQITYQDRNTAVNRRLRGEQLPPPVNADKMLTSIILTACNPNPKSRFKNPTAFKNSLLQYKKMIEETNANDSAQKSEDPDGTIELLDHTFFDSPPNNGGREPLGDNDDEIKYNNAAAEQANGTVPSLQLAISLFSQIPYYKDSAQRISACKARIEQLQNPKSSKKSGSGAIVAVIISAIAIITIIGILCAVLLYAFGGISCSKPDPYADPIDQTADSYYEETSRVVSQNKNVYVGDYITMGEYEQDTNYSNGKEPIEWLVLEKSGNQALVISRYCLDKLQYNTTRSNCTWSTCTARSWLNYDFYNTVFTTSEKTDILSATVYNYDNGTAAGGSTTTDKLFFLSIDEANQYFPGDSKKIAHATPYALYRGCYGKNKTSAVWWWLRSPGRDQKQAAMIQSTGKLVTNGDYVESTTGGVRPAMWIQIN